MEGQGQKVAKIFLTGATGFIGGSVLTLLLKTPEKYEVTALVRNEEAAAKLKTLGAIPVLGSLDDVEVLKKAAGEADAVMHLAHADHLVAVKAIVEGMIAGKRGIYIHTSGTGVIADDARGEFTGEEIYNDTDIEKIHAIPLTSLHRNVDTYIFDNSKEITTFIVAPPTIYGVGSGPFNRQSSQIPYMIRAFIDRGQAATIGKGLNVWSNVHVLDLADFYLLLLEKALEGKADTGREGGWYFAESGEYQFGEVAKRLAEILHARGALKTTEVGQFTPEEAEKYFFGSLAWPVWGGNSRCKSDRARALGWKPQREDLWATLENEVDIILAEKKRE